MKKHIALFFIFAVLSFLISWTVAGSLVSPSRSKVLLPETSLEVVKFDLESRSGENLAGWHIVNNNKKGVIVLFHGIRANKLTMFERAKLLYKAGYSLVLIDFQSHGESSGEQITVGYLEKYDVLAAIEYAKSHHQNEKVGVVGVSLGGAAVLLASPQNIDALVIESVYPDIQRAVHNRVKAKLGLFSWLPAEILLAQLQPRLGFSVAELSPIDKINTIKCPIFVISGEEDKHTTAEETRLMYMQANEPKQLWLAKGVEHEDIYNNLPTLYSDKVIGFFNSHMGSKL